MSAPNQVMPKSLAVLYEGRDAGWHLGAQLFVSRHGETLADLAIGENEPNHPLTPDTLMLWLSAVKPVAAIAIAQLWEQDKLGLDDFVSRFIPEFAGGGKQSITIRHLLTHTGGFRPADRIPENLSWEESLQRICRTPLEPAWVPGKKAGYHAISSWLVLGEIVRRMSGQRFEQYVRDHIFLPLHMTDSWIGMPAARFDEYRLRLGRMYRTDRGSFTPHPFWNSEAGWTGCRPGSNGRAPARDFGLFYEALLAPWASPRQPAPASGHPILSPATIRMFTSRHRVGMYDLSLRHVVDWGLGFMVNSQPQPHTLPYVFGRYASPMAFGHGGAQSSAAFADPAHGLVVCWLCNGQPGETRHQRRAQALNAAIYEDLGLAGTAA